MAKMLKERGDKRTTFRNICGCVIGASQASIISHFATCRKR